MVLSLRLSLTKRCVSSSNPWVVINMIGPSSPIEETTLGKELLARGKAEMLERMLKNGHISQDLFDKEMSNVF